MWRLNCTTACLLQDQLLINTRVEICGATLALSSTMQCNSFIQNQSKRKIIPRTFASTLHRSLVSCKVNGSLQTASMQQLHPHTRSDQLLFSACDTHIRNTLHNFMLGKGNARWPSSLLARLLDVTPHTPLIKFHICECGQFPPYHRGTSLSLYQQALGRRSPTHTRKNMDRWTGGQMNTHLLFSSFLFFFRSKHRQFAHFCRKTKQGYKVGKKEKKNCSSGSGDGTRAQV